MKKRVELVAKEFLKKIEEKEVQIVSHFDTDGITSASIMIKTLEKLDKIFFVKIVKNLEEEIISQLPKNKVLVFLDLGSNSFNHIKKFGLKDVFIIDHHEIIQEIPPEINIINPELHEGQKISSSILTYLFCRELISEDKGLAKLAILGVIGDMLERNIDKIGNQILSEGEIIRKRGILLYPSTRPLDKTLEFSSNPYIPEITGNSKMVIRMLREIGLKPENGKYKTLLELNGEEMSKLVTAIILKNPKANNSEKMIGDIFLIKFFNKLEDARELSAIINACSRLGESDIAIQICLEAVKVKKRAESLYGKYKRFIISGLEFVSHAEKIEGKDFVIINAKEEIKETIIGTIASILSNSNLYNEGTVITAMSYTSDNEKIKVSSRVVGKNGRNVREILNNIISKIGGEVGGHEYAAGCIIKQEKEKEFIMELKKNLEIEMVKV